MPDLGGLTFGDIIAALGPRTNDPMMLVIDILLYIIFAMNFIAFFMQDEKQLATTLLVGLTLLFTLVAKLEIIDAKELPMLIVNVGIFVIPLIVTGMSKAKKSKPLTIISGVIGGFYFFMFWFFFQRI